MFLLTEQERVQRCTSHLISGQHADPLYVHHRWPRLVFGAEASHFFGDEPCTVYVERTSGRVVVVDERFRVIHRRIVIKHFRISSRCLRHAALSVQWDVELNDPVLGAQGRWRLCPLEQYSQSDDVRHLCFKGLALRSMQTMPNQEYLQILNLLRL